jgi:hypothetical protein
MNQDTVESAVMQLIAEGVASQDSVKGCNEAEIAEIEKMYGLKLPTIYRQFLKRMGKEAGSFLDGTNYLCSTLSSLRRQAETLLKECNAQLSLDKNDFIFAVHQGYQFLFFNAQTSADPAVFLYLEYENSFKQVYSHFSEWLFACVSDEIAAFKELNK